MAKTKPVASKPSFKVAAKKSSKPTGRVDKKKKKPAPRKAKDEVKTTREKRESKKKQRIYTEAELGIPKLNMITPVGVEKPRGKKRGKVFVDDQDSMQTILAMVNAEKEGQIESKMIKARQMEEIREARRKEAEARQEQKRSKLEETKSSVKRKRKRASAPVESQGDDSPAKTTKSKKRVSFG